MIYYISLIIIKCNENTKKEEKNGTKKKKNPTNKDCLSVCNSLFSFLCARQLHCYLRDYSNASVSHTDVHGVTCSFIIINMGTVVELIPYTSCCCWTY